MLLVLVFILLLIWAAVVWSIYSNFLVFYSSFHESENYHRAYYNSIIALERSELVTKQRSPWFEGSGWWILGATSWNSASDGIITSNFSYEWNEETRKKSSAFRTIKSRTTRIPAEWNWDVEPMLATGDSDNFNMMDYNDSQVFLMFYDKSEQNPYKRTKCTIPESCNNSYPETITGVIRLPMGERFGHLNSNDSLVINWPKDDVIVDRQIRWTYQNNNKNYPFTIFSTQSLISKKNQITILPKLDNAIRESSINPWLNFKFWDSDIHKRRSPINNKWDNIVSKWTNNQKEVTIISPQETKIKEVSSSFKDILTNHAYSNKQLRFSLLNLLQTEESTNQVWLIYPFLEYYADFWTEISDKYFTINAEWNYDDYKINIIVRKPTIKESVLWSFTTIF